MKKLIEDLDRDFTNLYRGWREIIQSLDCESPYLRPVAKSNLQSPSCGEEIIKGARIVEQAFGGITANLWDDPFEWTQPETLTTRKKVLDYLEEVESTRRRAFEFFKSDDDLSKEIVTPSGSTKLLPFLLDTLQRARHHHDRAVASLGLQLTTDH